MNSIKQITQDEAHRMHRVAIEKAAREAREKMRALDCKILELQARHGHGVTASGSQYRTICSQLPMDTSAVCVLLARSGKNDLHDRSRRSDES